MGDIALPNMKYETEWREQRWNKTYLDELDKYKDQIENEGLQVEEEGLTGMSTFLLVVTISERITLL